MGGGEMKTDKSWVIYTRVSTDGQAEKGMSLAAQLAACRAYANERGWPIGEELVDDGYTGKTSKRPGFQRLLELVKAGSIAGIVGVKFNRIARNLDELRSLLKLCSKQSVEIVAITMHIDTTNPIGRMVVNVLGSVDEYFSEDTADQTSRTMRYVRDQGYWIGGRIPSGCTVIADGNRKRLVAGPDAAAVVPIWGMVLAGAGLHAIADHLRHAGVRITGRGGKDAPWTPNAARNLLLNRRVMGVLIDPSAQAQVRALLMSRATPLRRAGDQAPRSSERVSPLRGILHCSNCGGSCITCCARGNGGEYWYYRCVNKAKGTCKIKDVRCEVAESAIIRAVVQAAHGDEYQRFLWQHLTETEKRRLGARERKGQATSEHDQVKARMADLALAGPRPGTPEFNALLAPLGERLRALEIELGSLEGLLSVSDTDEDNIETAIGEIRTGLDRIEDKSPEEQRAALLRLVQSVVLYDDEVLVELYLPETKEPRAMPEVRSQLNNGALISTVSEPCRRTLRVRVPRVRAGIVRKVRV